MPAQAGIPAFQDFLCVSVPLWFKSFLVSWWFKISLLWFKLLVPKAPN